MVLGCRGAEPGQLPEACANCLPLWALLSGLTETSGSDGCRGLPLCDISYSHTLTDWLDGP